MVLSAKSDLTNMKNKFFNQRGFSLIEILLTIAIGSILLGLTTINLVKTQQKTNISASEESLIADIKSQQMKAMSGTNGASGGNFGVRFFGNNKYLLFQGTDYADGSTVTIDDGINFTDSTDIIFLSLTGEVQNYDPSNPPKIVISNNGGSETKTITLNKFGTVTRD